ncbi:MAG: hypothetical protein KJ672_06020, partial [Candidatus Thermoplasmatota archaeon]|nr:hypothetical protein [Candidatus Thermoplasmatota archaeon]
GGTGQEGHIPREESLRATLIRVVFSPASSKTLEYKSTVDLLEVFSQSNTGSIDLIMAQIVVI